MRVRNLGPMACLIEVGEVHGAASLAAWIRRHCPAIVEVVPAATTVLCDGVIDRPALSAAVASWSATESVSDARAVLEIPVRYDGPDLVEIARVWGMSPPAAAARHQGLTFVAAFCGFSPGFTYLAGLPDELRVSRMRTPRVRVPAGSVALADEWCAVYPQATPGGWRILGTTKLRLWDQERSEPALITPGQRVRFVAES